MQFSKERMPAFYETATGVLIDCFEDDWIYSNVIRAHLRAGKDVALVSPD